MTTALARLLRTTETTQLELAHALGVSQAVVSRWARGRSPMPPSRAFQAEVFLGASEGALAGQTSSGKSGPAPWTPKTLLGYLLTTGPLSEHLGATFSGRISGLASRTGVSPDLIATYARGRLPIPEWTVEKFCDVGWPGIHPACFGPETAIPKSGEVALRDALDDLEGLWRDGGHIDEAAALLDSRAEEHRLWPYKEWTPSKLDEVQRRYPSKRINLELLWKAEELATERGR